MADFIVIGTWNTKGEELEFVCRELTKRNHTPIRLDLSAKKGADDRDTVLLKIIDVAKKNVRVLAKKQHISGVLSIGGGTNLWMTTQIISEIPLMIPKVVVSTMIANSLTTPENLQGYSVCAGSLRFCVAKPAQRSDPEKLCKRIDLDERGYVPT